MNSSHLALRLRLLLLTGRPGTPFRSEIQVLLASRPMKKSYLTHCNGLPVFRLYNEMYNVKDTEVFY
jgi:hypothetical protein